MSEEAQREQEPERSRSRSPVSLGRHQLLFPIGHGGMSDVYLAAVTSAAGVTKLLVVKKLRASLLDEPEALSMFMDEARLAARLHHPNVVSTFEVGQEGPIPYMTMEFLDGQPLHRVIRRSAEPGVEPLTLGMRLRIIAEMLEGLHYAHELRDYDGTPLQVVHRDISPQNLFLTYDGQIKLVDFGIAKARDSLTQTEDGGRKGKLAYMSPEQARGESVDRRADVFAAGVMLWELLAGRRLWAAVGEVLLSRRLADGDLPALAIDGVPRRLIEICGKAMAPRIADRYPGAEPFRLELEGFMDDEGLDAGARAIGKRVARAFAEEQGQMRADIDAELMRLVGAGTRDDLPQVLWRERYRDDGSGDDLSERTLSSSAVGMPVIAGVVVDEVTAIDGPAPERPTGEVPALPAASGSELPAPRGHGRPLSLSWRATVVTAVGLGLLALTPLLGKLEGPEPATEASPPPAESPTPESSTPVPTPDSVDACARADKPVIELSGEIETDATLHCDRDYLLRFHTRVAAGATLTIEPGTTLLGDRETKGTLVIQPGARLIADGTRERPIVFTSNQAPGRRRPGDWGGVVLLGSAPINLRDADGRPIRGHVEGLTAGGRFGGDDPDDDSGVLRYVRIEYPGVEIGPANELNGLTLAGVGRGTILDHVQVRATRDDCFEFFGGTVDGKHLICDDPGDDGFDFDFGYQGRLQFLVVRDHGDPDDDGAGDGPSNAFEFDNDPSGLGVEPRTRPQIWNATACGRGGGRTTSYGVLARRAAAPDLHALLLGGFDYAIDVRDPGTAPTLAGLGLLGQLGAEVDERDDDDGFDEVAWLADPARAALADIDGLAGCNAPAPAGLQPREPLRVPIDPPADDGFFDTSATWLGAFAGPDDRWADADDGAWAIW